MKIALINGPNLNMLAYRDKSVYGDLSYESLLERMDQEADKLNIEYLETFQSNHEGEIIEYIQGLVKSKFDGILINPGAFAHYSIAILDALQMFHGVVVECHLSDVRKRESYRQVLITAEACDQFICGKGIDSYVEGLHYIVETISKK